MAAVVDQQAGRRWRPCRWARRGVPGGDELDPAPVELDRAAEVRVWTRARGPRRELGRHLDDRHDLGARALGDRDGVAVVVVVAVREEDPSAGTSSAETGAFGLPVRNGSISTSTSAPERWKQAWPRKRSRLASGVLLVHRARARGRSPTATPTACRPGLLGQQRAQRGDALVDVGAARRSGRPPAGARSRTSRPRPAPWLSMRWMCGRGSRDELLRRAQAGGVGERLHGGVDLRVRVRAVEARCGIIGAWHCAHVPVPRRRLRLQASARPSSRPIVAGLPCRVGPAVLVGGRHGRRRRRLSACATTSR